MYQIPVETPLFIFLALLCAAVVVAGVIINLLVRNQELQREVDRLTFREHLHLSQPSNIIEEDAGKFTDRIDPYAFIEKIFPDKAT